MECTWARQAIQELKLTSRDHDPACDEGLFQMLVTKGVLPNVKRIDVLLRPCLFYYHPNFFEEMSSAHGHQLECMVLLSEFSETEDELPYNLFSWLVSLFPNLKVFSMEVDFFDNDNGTWLPARRFRQPLAWRHLNEISIFCDIGDMGNDLAAATGNLKFLHIEISNLSGENLQAILVANPGLQELRVRDVHGLLHDDEQIIGNYGKNLLHIECINFRKLDDGNLVDLVGEDSKLCRLEVDDDVQLTVAGFRRLFVEKDLQLLGKGDGYILVGDNGTMGSLKSAFPDRNWRCCN
jgi:hypothetical protein